MQVGYGRAVWAWGSRRGQWAYRFHGFAGRCRGQLPRQSSIEEDHEGNTMSIADWLHGSKCTGCGQRSREEKHIDRVANSPTLLCRQCHDKLQEERKRKEEERRKEEKVRALKLWIERLKDLQTATPGNAHARVGWSLWSLKQVAALCAQLSLEGFRLYSCTSEYIRWGSNKPGYRPCNLYYEIFYQKPDVYSINASWYGSDEGGWNITPEVPSWLEQVTGEA